jgi:tRNA (adenine57-N1/adenine58-N1)-methyltransferase
MPPDVRKRALKKPSYADEDVELWTPGAVGDRQITDKNLRKRVREAQRAADGARQASADAVAAGRRSGRRRLIRCAGSLLPSPSSACLL